jgi:hypothetical protein
MNEIELIKPKLHYSRKEISEIFNVSPTTIIKRFEENNVPQITHIVKGGEKRIYYKGEDVINGFKIKPDLLKVNKSGKKKYGIELLPANTKEEKMKPTLEVKSNELTEEKSMWTVLNYLYDRVKELTRENKQQSWYLNSIFEYTESIRADINEIKKAWDID